AAVRVRRRRQPSRAARPEARARGPGLAAPAGRAGVVPAACRPAGDRPGCPARRRRACLACGRPQGRRLPPGAPPPAACVRTGARARLVGAQRGAALGARVTRVTVVSPEPTPYRAPLFDRIARRMDLTVVYAARTVAGREWTVPLQHRAVFLRGARVPGVRKLLRHDYPVTPGVVPALARSRPDVVVVSGWSTFASQTAVAWCRALRVPY